MTRICPISKYVHIHPTFSFMIVCRQSGECPILQLVLCRMAKGHELIQQLLCRISHSPSLLMNEREREREREWVSEWVSVWECTVMYYYVPISCRNPPFGGSLPKIVCLKVLGPRLYKQLDGSVKSVHLSPYIQLEVVQYLWVYLWNEGCGLLIKTNHFLLHLTSTFMHMHEHYKSESHNVLMHSDTCTCKLCVYNKEYPNL